MRYAAAAKAALKARSLPSRPVVFVSSTSDLKIEREKVRDLLEKLGGNEFVGMELFESRPEQPRQVCLEQVARCNVYLGIVGGRYGSIDEETGLSMTELEYTEAIRLGLYPLIFIQRNDQPPHPDGHLQQVFVQRLQAAHTCKYFSNPDNLATEVSVTFSRSKAAGPFHLGRHLTTGLLLAAVLVWFGSTMGTPRFDGKRLAVLVLSLSAPEAKVLARNVYTGLTNSDPKADNLLDFEVWEPPMWRRPLKDCSKDALARVREFGAAVGLCVVNGQQATLVIAGKGPATAAEDPLEDLHDVTFQLTIVDPSALAPLLMGIAYFCGGQFGNGADSFSKIEEKAWPDPYFKVLYAHSLLRKDPSGCGPQLELAEKIYDSSDKVARDAPVEQRNQIISMTLTMRANVKRRLSRCSALAAGTEAIRTKLEAQAEQAEKDALFSLEKQEGRPWNEQINACERFVDPKASIGCLTSLGGKLKNQPELYAHVMEAIGDNNFQLASPEHKEYALRAIDHCKRAAQWFEENGHPVDAAYSYICVANATYRTGTASETSVIYRKVFQLLKDYPEAQRIERVRGAWLFWALDVLELGRADPNYRHEACDVLDSLPLDIRAQVKSGRDKRDELLDMCHRRSEQP